MSLAGLGQVLDRGEGGKGTVNGDQLVIGGVPSAILPLFQGKGTDLGPIFPTGYNPGISLPDGGLQNGVGMPADNDVNIGGSLGQQLILRIFWRGRSPAMGQADNQIRVRFLPDLLDDLVGRIPHLLKGQAAGRGVLRGTLPEKSEEGHQHPISF